MTQIQEHASSYVLPGSLLIASVLLLVWLQLRPVPAQPVIVFFAPGTSPTEALADVIGAGGRLISLGAYSNSLIVQSEQLDFFDRLRQAGAWLIIDAGARGGCRSNNASKE